MLKSKLFFNYFKRRKTIALSFSKKLSALIREIISKHLRDFYCLNCLLSFATEKET